MKQFKGRVLASGTLTAEAVVSHQGVNTLASFQKAVVGNKKNAVISDQGNKDLYGLDVTNKILCLPITIGSTTGGLVIQTICAMKIAPAAFLFSEHIDSLAGSGIVLARIWENSPVIAIDELGKEFLETVKTGDKLEIKEDGTVVIL
ncbi:MAG TPA: DUF126 domain-containing protein [Bacilli bacterium]|nr:DUF126 domain-containing protein [Bacilli bacterium]HPS19280.1 DUF126 domain-containing protein [Bacilli bacterium]